MTIQMEQFLFGKDSFPCTTHQHVRMKNQESNRGSYTYAAYLKVTECQVREWRLTWSGVIRLDSYLWAVQIWSPDKLHWIELGWKKGAIDRQTVCFMGISKSNQSIQSKRRVTDPWCTIIPTHNQWQGTKEISNVPVSWTTNKFGQWKGRTGNNCTSRLENQQFECKSTAVYGFFPWSIIGRSSDPSCPVVIRRLKQTCQTQTACT
jgi:hypothetical protein